jgi:hypothetical protein
MAPFIGPTKAELIALLQKRKPELPITLGLYSPQATVENAGGRWRIVALEEDVEASRRAGEEALKTTGHWMPEHTWQFLRPGRLIVDAPSREELIEAVRNLDWPWSTD